MPGSRELGRVLTVPRGQQTALQGYRDTVCRGQAVARAHRFSELAAELRNQLDAAKIAQQVRPARQPACRSGTWAVLGSPAPGLRSSLSPHPWSALLDPQAAPLLASCVSCGCPPCSTLTSAAPAEQPPDPAPSPGPASAHSPCFPSAGPERPQWLCRPAAAATPTAAAGAPGGPAGRPEGPAGRGRPLGPGLAAASGRLRRPGSWARSQRPWRGGQQHWGWGGPQLQQHGRGGGPARCSPGPLGRAAGPVLRLRAALGRPAAHPVWQQPVGGWQGAGVRKAGGAGPAPRPGSDTPSLVPAHGPPLPANGLPPAPARKPRAHPSLPVPRPTSLACLPQHHRARGAEKGQHELPGLHEQGAAEPGPPRTPHDQQPQDPVRARGLRGRPCHSQGLHLGLPVSSGAGTEGAGQRALQAGGVSGGAAGGRIGMRGVQP